MAPLEDGNTGIEDDASGARVNNGRLQIIPADASGNPVAVNYDSDRGLYLLAISGQVVVGPPPMPSGATPVNISADTPLNVNGTDDTNYTITNGTTFCLQQLVAGAEDSPVAAGSVVEVIFDDGAEHVVARIYVAGFTNIVSYLDLCKARDGTTLTGNGTNEIIIRRRRLSNQTLEVEGVLNAYEV
jgi:hypothetical protein